jgi:hypothetical protein
LHLELQSARRQIDLRTAVCDGPWLRPRATENFDLDANHHEGEDDDESKYWINAAKALRMNS